MYVEKNLSVFAASPSIIFAASLYSTFRVNIILLVTCILFSALFLFYLLRHSFAESPLFYFLRYLYCICCATSTLFATLVLFTSSPLLHLLCHLYSIFHVTSDIFTMPLFILITTFILSYLLHRIYKKAIKSEEITKINDAFFSYTFLISSLYLRKYKTEAERRKHGLVNK